MTQIDNRSKKFLFIPYCLICQAFQAQGLVKYDWKGMITPIIDELVKEDINLIQMPCPESKYGGYETGLTRSPMSIDKYDNSSFREICRNDALEVVNIIKSLLSVNYEIIGIIGIEFSPSCAIKYQYTNKGIIKRQGIFMEVLSNHLSSENININFVGINRRGMKKSIKDIKNLFQENKQHKITNY